MRIKVYGVGTGTFKLLPHSSCATDILEGIQKTPTWARMFLHFAKANGHSGTFGRGLNCMSNIHVKDVAFAILTVLKVALGDRAEDGINGLCRSTRLKKRLKKRLHSAQYCKTRFRRMQRDKTVVE